MVIVKFYHRVSRHLTCKVLNSDFGVTDVFNEFGLSCDIVIKIKYKSDILKFDVDLRIIFLDLQVRVGNINTSICKSEIMCGQVEVEQFDRYDFRNGWNFNLADVVYKTLQHDIFEVLKERLA